MTLAIVFLVSGIKNVTVSRSGMLCVDLDDFSKLRLEMRLCLRPPKSRVPLICSDVPPMTCGTLDAHLQPHASHLPFSDTPRHVPTYISIRLKYAAVS